MAVTAAMLTAMWRNSDSQKFIPEKFEHGSNASDAHKEIVNIKFYSFAGNVIASLDFQFNETIGSVKARVGDECGKHVLNIIQGGRNFHDGITLAGVENLEEGLIVAFGDPPSPPCIPRSNSVVSLCYKDGPGD